MGLFRKPPSRGGRGGRGGGGSRGRGRGGGGGRGYGGGGGGGGGRGYKKKWADGKGDYRGPMGGGQADAETAEDDYVASKLERMMDQAAQDDAMDKRFGFDKFTTAGAERLGWLINMHPTVFRDTETNQCRSGVDYYFLQQDGGRFKVCLPYQPYFLLRVKDGTEAECEQYLRRKFEGKLAGIARVEKEDLDKKNHLVGLKQTYLKLSFANVQDLMTVRSKVSPIVNKNKANSKEQAYGDDAFASASASQAASQSSYAGGGGGKRSVQDVADFLLDLREYDVPYHMRVSIDMSINVAKWYEVKQVSGGGPPEFIERPDLLDRPDPSVLAWDIETTKLPLKFPNAETDQIMMISYMVDGQGYLINNREILSEDVEDFEYTPKPEFEGPFEVFNEPDELAVIRRFFDHIQEIMPLINVTYNGDGFDWPFLDQRATVHGMSLYKEIGFRPDNQNEYKARHCLHMDCFRWVKRDSYLPVGSQGLKAVTKAKLRYDPIEIHYEEICRMAAEEPQELSNYSVSDAVATYYLYMKYVHPFIFALCTIIPLGPDDVLRKGSGTLCESLLMYQAYHDNVVMPNKHQTEYNKLHEGHLIESETYIGGHVEALESGVFRNDIPCRFRLVPDAVQQLIDGLDDALRYAIVEEEKFDFDAITNYDEELGKLRRQLEDLRDSPYRKEVPLIYHLDVAAMYPNIILTNRLQPMAMVDEATCAACEFNRPDSKCQRQMDWAWRADISPAGRGEYEMVKQQLESERFPAEDPDDPPVPFHDLDREQQASLIKKRLGLYSRKVYKKTKDTVVVDRKSTVCQRENPFYIDTVRAFRDRRYVYKGKLKDAKRELEKVIEGGDPAEIKRMSNLVVLYDSLQLAHKCILNSFYGYVMRKGARWYSLEMAGIVCLTGANIITKAREIVEQIGRPLELDTDGIWCVLPGSFPENVEFKTKLPGKKSKLVVSYPGAMLNVMVKDHFTNHQYQMLKTPGLLEYEISTVNSIFFEVDGPYKAMILPASKEKDKRLKKRYAVYDLDGSLAELKGFEIKRNGELKIIKVFQAGVFDTFLEGTTLDEIYQCVARCANHWLDILYSRGENMTDAELFDLISENRSMSRLLSEYNGQKSTSISTAKRLAEFLGDDMVKDKGLACQFIISKKPEGAPVTERAIPVAIFQSSEAVKRSFLRKWLKLGGQPHSFDLRDVLDWEYYIERLGSAIMKIITIPAAMQKVANPVPRVKHPDWLHARLLESSDKMKQKKITELFSAKSPAPEQLSLEDEDRSLAPNMVDIEDQFGGLAPAPKGVPRVTVHGRKGGRGGRKGASLSSSSSQQQQPSPPQQTGDEPDAADGRNWREALGPEPPLTDQGAWLAYNKKKWRLQRKERHRVQAMGISGASVKSRRGDLGGYFERQAHTVNRTHWEIVQVVETDEPGVMRVWALVAGDLHCMKVQCHRQFFVNMRVPDTSGLRRRVFRALPRARQCLNLYEFALTEREYLENQRQFSSYFAHPDVEGVYERQVPLLWRTIVELGCVCGVNPKVARQRGGSHTQFSLPDFDFKSTSKCAYLEDGSMQRVYLHHNQSGGRAMFGLFFPQTGKAHVYVVDPGKNDALPSLGRTWRETYKALEAELDDDDDDDDDDDNNNDGDSANGEGRGAGASQRRRGGRTLQPHDIEFERRVFENAKGAGRPLNALLQQYIDERHGPTVLVLQSPSHLSNLQVIIPSLQDFPVVQEPANPKDNQYPALDWQKFAARALLIQYGTAGTWLDEHVKKARYAHVPVGNLPADYKTFIADVFFARALKHENHLLWVSPSALPDLGGKEEDDNRLMTDDADTVPRINLPGVYPYVCVEIDVNTLAVNTILQSSHVNDIEGAAGPTMAFDSLGQTSLEDMMGAKGSMSMLTSFDETAQCTPVFRILKSIVHTWLQEVIKHNNEHADEQLMDLYRWLKLPEAKLYDPALYRMVQYMMKKVFMQLLSMLRRLGAVIISANMSKIVIGTKKTHVDDAHKYVDYILARIKEKPLFGTLDLEPVAFWEHLVWMDSSNYGGVKEMAAAVPRGDGLGGSADGGANDDDDDDDDDDEDEMDVSEAARLRRRRGRKTVGSDDEGEDDDVDDAEDGYATPAEDAASAAGLPEGRVVLNWNIAEFLPQVCRVQFTKVVSEWIVESWQSRIAARNAPGGVGRTPVKGRPADDDDDGEADADILAVLDARREHLMHVVPQVAKTIPGDAAREHSDDFPMLAGSHLRMNNPALELVKTVCSVLALDAGTKETVQGIKRNLLKMIRVREFSDEAKFKDPCLTFELSDVVCTFCHTVRAFDLCRDQRLTAGDWSCPECENEFPKDVIEDMLIQHVHSRTVAFQLQDLKCPACNMVKDDNMSAYCKCSGVYSLKVGTKSLLRKLHTLKRIASYHEFAYLEEEVDWMLRMSGEVVAQ